MSDREKSFCAYGLSALAILAAAMLCALRVLEAKDTILVISWALGAVGLFHATAPGQRVTPPTSTWLLLPLLFLGLPACHVDGPVSLVNAQASGARTAAGAPSAVTQLNFDQSQVPLTCPDRRGCLGVNSTTGLLHYVTPAGVGADLTSGPSLASTAPADVGTSAAVGAATTVARADHVHALPAVGAGPGTYCGAGQYLTSLQVDAQGRVILPTCATPPSGPSLANPTATIGLTAANGSAASAMRSDAAPALDQGIAPTWTGSHTFALAVTASTSVLTPLVDRASAGTLSLGGTATTVQLAAGASLSGASGAGAVSLGALTGNTTIPTGSFLWTGAAGKTWTATAGGGAYITYGSGGSWYTPTSGTLLLDSGSDLDLRSRTGYAQLTSQTSYVQLTSTGNYVYLSPTASGPIDLSGGTGVRLMRGVSTIADAGVTSSTLFTLRAGISLSGAAGSGGLSLGSMTGNWDLPTGAGTWTGASDKTLSFTAQGSLGTMLLRTTGSGAHLTLQTSGLSAYVLADGTTGVVMRRAGTTQLDVGNTSSSAVTLGAGISLSGASGSGGLSLGSMTGNSSLPKGDLTWNATANKNLSLYASGTGVVDIQSGGAMYLLGGGLLRGNGTNVEINATSSNVVIDSQTGINLSRVTTVLMDVGGTSSTAVTLRAGISLSGAAGAGGLSLGSMTGNIDLPTGTWQWYGASNKYVVFQAQGAGGTIFVGAAAPITLTSDNEIRLQSSGANRLTIGAGVTVRPDTATPAGGSTSARLLFGTTSGFGIYYGSGAPTVSAAKGSLYLRDNGSGTGDRLYINTDGSTGWTAVTTAS